jgi:serine protease Do
MKKILVAFLIAVSGGAASIGLYKLAGFDQKQIILQNGAPAVGQLADFQPGQGVPFDFTMPAEKVTPAVVHIRSQISRSEVSNDRRQMPPGFEDFFGDLFGGGGGRGNPRGPREGAGSGVIISPEGHIITNNHVIDQASEITVMLTDKREYKAKLIGTDPTTDIALIKIDAKDLPVVPFGNSDDIKVGQWVLAVGNPFGYLHSTVTAGIVSAKGRNIRILSDSMSIEAFIQTDAVVNPGNSGGALVDVNGNLVGINTAIASQTGQFAGYAFAVPANLAKKVAEDLLKYGTVQRALLGINITDLNAQMAKELGLSINEGVVVARVVPGGAAAGAGLQTNDVIINIEGQPVKSVAGLQEVIGRKRPGDQVKLTYLRDGKERQTTVTLKNQSGNTSLVKAETEGMLGQLGVQLEGVSAADLAKMGLENGVRVSKIGNGKIRNQTDMREGFVITKVGNRAVRSADDVRKALEGTTEGVMIAGRYPGQSTTQYYAFGMGE